MTSNHNYLTIVQSKLHTLSVCGIHNDDTRPPAAQQFTRMSVGTTTTYILLLKVPEYEISPATRINVYGAHNFANMAGANLRGVEFARLVYELAMLLSILPVAVFYCPFACVSFFFFYLI